MTEPHDLSDAELLARAHRWRREAMRGAPHARDPAHRHEAEVRRRFGGATTIQAPLEMRPGAKRSRPWWLFW